MPAFVRVLLVVLVLAGTAGVQPAVAQTVTAGPDSVQVETRTDSRAPFRKPGLAPVSHSCWSRATKLRRLKVARLPKRRSLDPGRPVPRTFVGAA